MRKRPHEDQTDFGFDYSFGPGRQAKYLMLFGVFATIDQYRAWVEEPLEGWDEPAWQEIAERQMGCFSSGHVDDNDPDLLWSCKAHAEAYLAEKEDRLYQQHGLEPLRKTKAERAW